MVKAKKLFNCISNLEGSEKSINLQKINQLSEPDSPITPEDWVNFYEPIFIGIYNNNLLTNKSKLELLNEDHGLFIMNVVLKDKNIIFQFNKMYSQFSNKRLATVDVYYKHDHKRVYFAHGTATDFTTAIHDVIVKLNQQTYFIDLN
ncbi:hypothetical protein ACYATM_06635 [Lactobacillaceae bacterium Scapto_B20]